MLDKDDEGNNVIHRVKEIFVFLFSKEDST